MAPGNNRKKATSEREEGRAKQREGRERGREIASEGERGSGLCVLLTKWTCRLMFRTG